MNRIATALAVLAAGSAVAASDAAAHYHTSAPSNTSLPTISGSATQGSTLTAGNGSWTNSPTSYSYQWKDCDTTGANCVSVSGATAGAYVLKASDAGHTMRVAVTARNAYGSRTATSAATSTVVGTSAPPAPPPPPPPPPPTPPANMAPPQATGTDQSGSALSASTGSWSNTPTSYGYQWQDCDTTGANCSGVAGANTASYMLASTDVGHTIRVVVTASNSSGAASATSAPTAAVTAPSSGGTGGTAPAFEIGVNSNSNTNTQSVRIGALGAKVARVDFLYTATVADLTPVITAFANAGVRVQPIFDFYGTMPTTAQAQALASWAAAFGPGGTFWAGRTDGNLAVQNIEFGNETSYNYQYGDQWNSASYLQRAQNYALTFAAAHAAIQGSGGNAQVGLLAQGEDGGTGSTNWVSNMFSAVPNFASLVAGWVVHPYGPSWQSYISKMQSELATVGVPNTAPIYVTEYGIASDNGVTLSDNYGWPTNLTYSQAATDLQGAVTGMHSTFPSIAQIDLYEASDNAASGTSTSREDYFGLVQAGGATKGAITTTAESLIASAP